MGCLLNSDLSSIYRERLRDDFNTLQRLYKDNQNYCKAVQAAYQILEQLRLHPQLSAQLSLAGTSVLPEEKELPIYLDFLLRVIEHLLKTELESELLKRIRQGLLHLLPRLWYSPEFSLQIFEKTRSILQKKLICFRILHFNKLLRIWIPIL